MDASRKGGKRDLKIGKDYRLTADLLLLCPVLSYSMLCYPVLSYLSCSILSWLSCSILSFLSCSILPFLSCSILFFLSCPVLSCSILFYPVLSFLFYPILLYRYSPTMRFEAIIKTIFEKKLIKKNWRRCVNFFLENNFKYIDLLQYTLINFF